MNFNQLYDIPFLVTENGTSCCTYLRLVCDFVCLHIYAHVFSQQSWQIAIFPQWYIIMVYYISISQLFILCLTLFSQNPASSLRVKGSIRPDDFFVVVAKFAGQRFELSGSTKHSMYVFGNASASSHDQDVGSHNLFTLVVVDKTLFLDLYKNKSVQNRNKACHLMMDKIGKLSYYSAPANTCISGTVDYLRSLPCPENVSCYNQPEDVDVVPNYQFTFEIDRPEEK